MGMEQVLCAPRSPWHRAYIERVIGTIRRECLDHVIIFSEAGLYRHVKHSRHIITGAEHISHWPRIRPSRGRCSRQNLDASWLSRKWAASITVTSDAQPENGGDNVCPHERGVRPKAFSSLFGHQSPLMAAH
jgi:Integrase core domain